MADSFLTVSGLALELRLTEHTVRKAVRRGVLPSTRAGRVGVFAVADLPLIRTLLVEAGILPEPGPVPVPHLGDVAAGELMLGDTVHPVAGMM